VGFYISGHPLSKYASKLAELGAIDLATVEGRRNGEEITVAGIVVAMRSMRSRKGDRWGILTLQDMTGVLEVLAFPESFARLELLFKSNAPLVLKGRVNVEEAGTRLAVMDGRKLEDMGQRPPSVMRVRVNLGAVDAGVLDELKELFTNKPGSCAVAFDLISAEGAVATLRVDQRVRADQELVREVCRLCGENAVQLEARA
jgi:DNA polymerase-3 subunit alpha